MAESSEPLRAWAERAPGRLLGIYETVMYTPLLRLPEFLVGVLLARLFALGWRLPTAAGTLALGGLLFVGLVWTPPRPDTLVSNGALTPFFAALILAVVGGRDWLCRPFALSVMVRLGEASFAVYVLHYGILRAMVPGNGALPLYMGDGAMTLYLGVTLAASLLTFHAVEQPMRGMIMRAYARLRPLGVRSAAPAVAEQPSLVAAP